jgi:hypothetical protein
MFSWLFEARSQTVLNSGTEFLPDRSDTSDMKREVAVFLRIAYNIPEDKQTSDFQKRRLGDQESRNHMFGAEMEILGFAPGTHDRMLETHGFVRLEGYPMHYMSSYMGLGVSCRPLAASIGAFAGQYYRQVASEGNFVTRRRRQFDNYPLHGIYLQTSSSDASFFFSVTFEKREAYFTTRIASRIGQTLSLGREGSRLRSLQAIVSSEKFSGAGAGASIEVWPQVRTEVLWIVPEQRERDQQARLGNKLTSGFLVSTSFYVN